MLVCQIKTKLVQYYVSIKLEKESSTAVTALLLQTKDLRSSLTILLFLHLLLPNYPSGTHILIPISLLLSLLGEVSSVASLISLLLN